MLLSFGTSTPGHLLQYATFLEQRCHRDQPDKQRVLNIRNGCSRTIGGVGFTMLYYQTDTALHDHLRDPLGGSRRLQEIEDLASASMPDEVSGHAIPRKVWIVDANPLRFDQPTEIAGKPSHFSFRHPEQPGVLSRFASLLSEDEIEIAQHDAFLLRNKYTKRIECDHWFRIYGTRGAAWSNTKLVNALRSIFANLPSQDRKAVIDSIDFKSPNPGRGLIPGNLPRDFALGSTRFMYLVCITKNKLGILAKCAHFLQAARCADRRVFDDQNRTIIRSAVRSLGGWSVIVLCAAVMADPDDLDSECKTLAAAFKSYLRRNNVDDILYANIFASHTVPWHFRSVSHQGYARVDVQVDRPFLLADYLRHVYGNDLLNRVNIVQYDSWSRLPSTSGLSRSQGEAKQVFGLLALDDSHIQAWQTRTQRWLLRHNKTSGVG